MPQKFALIIGNSDYQDTALAHLAMPEADVSALASVLADPQMGGFDQVKPLVNASAADVRLEIESFFDDKKPDDLLLLYFTGHGVRDDQGQLYLAVNDTKHNRLRASAIDAAYITSLMDRSRSKRQVLILDCCHSGSFAQGSKAMTGESVGTKSAFEGTGYGRVVLTATDATQYAWEGDALIGTAQNSVFTRYLLQGLRTGEADTDQDGRITLDELYDYVYEQVVTVTPKQTPGKWSYKQQGEIVIAQNPHPVAKPAALPDDLQQSIADSRAWVREGAVSALSGLLQSDNARQVSAAYQALKQLSGDDSRKVAAAASAALAAHEQRIQPPATPAPPAAPAQNRLPLLIAGVLLLLAIFGIVKYFVDSGNDAAAQAATATANAVGTQVALGTLDAQNAANALAQATHNAQSTASAAQTRDTRVLNAQQTADAQATLAAGTALANAHATSTASALAALASRYGGTWLKNSGSEAGITQLDIATAGQLITLTATAEYRDIQVGNNWASQACASGCSWGSAATTYRDDPIAVTLDLRNGAKHILAISYIADLATLSVADQTLINNGRVGTPRAYAFHHQFTGPTKFATISPAVTCKIFASC